MKRVFVVFICLLLTVPCRAKTVYVDVDAAGANNGSTWNDAYNYLQDALIAVVDGDEIRVAEGIYTPDKNSTNPNGTGDRNASFVLVNGVKLCGGFAGNGSGDSNDRKIESYETILSGDLTGNDGPNFTNNSENSYHVVYQTYCDSTTVLDGFTIKAGNANGSYPNNRGGGMYSYGVSGSPTQPTISNCIFIGNYAQYYGGGIYSHYSYSMVTNCKFIANLAGSDGGGVYNNSCALTVVNCIFSGNSANRGGGMHNHIANHQLLINCTFSTNSAGTGGGICNDHSATDATLNNCILWDNNDSGGMDESAQVHRIGGVLIVNYCCIQGLTGSLGGIGNIGTDPCFVNTFVGDYHLKSQAGRWKPSIYKKLDPTNDGFINLVDFAAFADFWCQAGQSLPADLDNSGLIDWPDLKFLLDSFLSFYLAGSWEIDDVTSACIDAGDPNSDWTAELWPHGKRINMGAYGGTPQASMSVSTVGNIANLDNDPCDNVDFNDFALFTDKWLCREVLLTEDLDRNGIINLVDFAIFAQQWPHAIAGPGIEYKISPCLMGTSATEQLNRTRFTVTVEGEFIHFEDVMVANCCADELWLEMDVTSNLITIHEHESAMFPCRCICNYPVDANLGPFEHGTYTLEVYEDYGGFIGIAIVTIK